jgi:hypothetical protein
LAYCAMSEPTPGRDCQRAISAAIAFASCPCEHHEAAALAAQRSTDEAATTDLLFAVLDASPRSIVMVALYALHLAAGSTVAVPGTFEPFGDALSLIRRARVESVVRTECETRLCRWALES